MSKPLRFGKVIGVKADKLEEYLEHHRHVTLEVEATIKQCNFRNFSIFVRRLPDDEHYLFLYFEYTGEDFDADNARMAADPKTLEWWALMTPLITPLPDVEEGELWADMAEAYHLA